jgi:hypothetical protein
LRVDLTHESLDEALSDKPRQGGAPRRKIGTDPAHEEFLRDTLDNEPRLYGAEQCRLFRQRFGIDVAVSTMWRFVHKECGLSRKRLGKPSPFDSLSDANRERRRAFVAEHFDSAALDTVGTSDELVDQKKWRLKKSKNKKNLKRVEQLFFVDETGCNRHRHCTGRTAMHHVAKQQLPRRAAKRTQKDAIIR